MPDEPPFDDVIEADSHKDAAEQLAETLGVESGDTVRIRTPQFEREDGVEPDVAPATTSGYDALKSQSEEELRDLGLRPWGEYGLWLLPHEWHPHIPDEYELIDIFGRVTMRGDKPANPDKRFGVVSFGIIPEFERPVELPDDPGPEYSLEELAEE